MGLAPSGSSPFEPQPSSRADGLIETFVGRTPAALAGPIGVRCHPDGRVFVVDDLAHTILVFDRAGAPVDVLGRHGAGPGELMWPDAVHWDSDGRLFVADTGANRVQMWTPEGRFVHAFGRDRSPAITRARRVAAIAGAAAMIAAVALIVALVRGGQPRRRAGLAVTAGVFAVGLLASAWAVGAPRLLRTPRDLWIAPDGDIYVADYGSDVVRVFAPDGALLRTIGTPGSGPGQLHRPLGVVVSEDRRVYVSDSGNRRVQVFTTAGTFVGTIGGPGDPGRLTTPHGVALDGGGRVYVADRSEGRVRIFSAEGAHLGTIGGSGSSTDAFSPGGLCLSTDGTLLIADTVGHRIVAWRRTEPPAREH